MGRVDDVIDVLGIACTAAINAAGITTPAQGYQGWPGPQELTELLNQAQWALSIYPLRGGRRLPPRGKDYAFSSIPIPTLTATVEETDVATVTFAGTAGAYNIYLLYQHPTLGMQAAYYRSSSTDTPATVAAALALLIESPVTASTDLGVMTISGAGSVRCNIGASGTIARFQSRFEQRIQVSVWTPNAYQNTSSPSIDTPKSLRAAVCDAIVNNVGTDMNMWYALPDGTDARIRLSAMPVPRDDSQTDYNVYEAHMIFLAEYVLMSSESATQLGEIQENVAINDTSPVTYIGG